MRDGLQEVDVAGESVDGGAVVGVALFEAVDGDGFGFCGGQSVGYEAAGQGEEKGGGEVHVYVLVVERELVAEGRDVELDIFYSVSSVPSFISVRGVDVWGYAELILFRVCLLDIAPVRTPWYCEPVGEPSHVSTIAS